MNKFNIPRRNIAKERRAKRTERRKLQTGNPSLKVTIMKTNTSVSGKKQRKLKKLHKAQQQAVDSGLVTMQDIEMMAADSEAGGSSDLSKTKTKKNKRVFAVRKRAKLRLKQAGSLKEMGFLGKQDNRLLAYGKGARFPSRIKSFLQQEQMVIQ